MKFVYEELGTVWRNSCRKYAAKHGKKGKKNVTLPELQGTRKYICRLMR